MTHFRRLRGDVWTEAEINIVRSYYPDYKQIEQRLPHRTAKAVEHCARRNKIANKRARTQHTWTAVEVSRLRRMYRPEFSPTEIEAAFPGLRRHQIHCMATYMRLSCRRPPKTLGVGILDAVRQQAFRMHIPLKELDEECRASAYWAKAVRRINWRYVERAVQCMGGTIQVTFEEDAIERA